MSRYLLACSAAGFLALSAAVVAQTPPAIPHGQPASPVPAAQSQPIATVEGCLVREQDVPGRKPNAAEKAGAMEDYILTNAKVVKGSAPPSVATKPKADEPTGTSGAVSAPMFDVKGLDDARLKEFVGKRVTIEGTFADVDRSASAGPNKDLV